jgi:hypothetical protein
VDLERAEKRYHEYDSRVKALYRYHLITSNCVTELVREIKAVFPGEDFVISVNGSEFEPGEGTTFIPFRFFDCWVSGTKIRRVSYMPSFRKRRLISMYREENPLMVYLREFNTVTSSIYRTNPVDTSFLIFTDDALIPIHPLLGAVNTAWGILATLTGIVSMPFDRAKRFRQGFWGVMYSLPELCFFNIRKGTFSWTGRHK